MKNANQIVHSLYHITSIDRLISIVRQRRYRPAYLDPAAGDSGLNAGIVGRPLTRQQFEQTGVRLLLEYAGPLVPMQRFPLPVGSIYDELPWRVVVPNGTTEGLAMVGLQFEQGVSWEDVAQEAPWWAIGGRLQACWREHKAQEIKNEIMGILEGRPMLRVG